ncbi:MAG TPA: Bax inhibitor-1/YccA family protein [Caulobacteraceae bacterium]|nr:Bax inhibitor-1/YccA family protein [Caulobacteraceae bacterium]
MSDFNNGYPRAIPSSADMAVDTGLRAFMLGVYNKLALGLGVAGVLAWVTGNVPEVTSMLFQQVGRGITYTPLGWVVALAPVVLLFGSMFTMKNPTARGTGVLYWLVVAAIGAGGGLWFLRYTDASLASTFFVTAAAFGALSLWGYTTKRNLSGLGTFLFMGLIGLILASLVFAFLPAAQNPMFYFIINALGVLIFAGFIAYDTQRMKMGYYAAGGDRNMLGVLTNWAALGLFINFVNLFQFLLSFLGNRE